MQPNGSSLLIVNHEGLGDTVLSFPFLSVIAHAFADCERYLWLSRGRRDLFAGWNSFQVLENGEDQEIATVLGKHHDIVFDLGTGTDHVMDRVSQGHWKYDTYVGFAKPEFIPREVPVPRSRNISMWRQFLSLASTLGIPCDTVPAFRVQASECSKSYAEMLLDLRRRLPIICLAPGASCNHLKRWPAECFAAYMRSLHAKMPCRFVLIGHPSERQVGDEISGLVEFEIDNLIGLTPLGSLIHILSQSQLLLANDNGAMHLGGLLGIPTIGLFGPTNPQVYSPLGTRSVVIAARSGDVSSIDPEYVLNESLKVME
jgi:ADP-heptose:LPS heptosyltransferase